MYRAAFPQEDLVPLVRQILVLPSSLSLVARDDNAVVGHIAFTDAHIERQQERLALLAPLAVSPDRQRSGIGRALVTNGHRRLKAAGVAQVHVLGNPAYYRRLGYAPNHRIAPPYPLPEAWRGAWQSVRLNPGAALVGQIGLPDVWLNQSLWSP